MDHPEAITSSQFFPSLNATVMLARYCTYYNHASFSSTYKFKIKKCSPGTCIYSKALTATIALNMDFTALAVQ